MTARRWPALAVVVALLAVVPAGAADADERRPRPTPKTRQVEGVRPWAWRHLRRAHEALAQGRAEDALGALGDMQRDDGRLSAGERALMYRTLGSAYALLDRHREAAAAFESALDGEALPAAGRADVHHVLAQLYAVLERHEAALRHARTAVRERSDAPEGWLRLLLSLLIERRHFAEAAALLERLITVDPTTEYWTQLSAVYGELGREVQSLAALEAAHAQGLLSSGRELTTLAQLRLRAGVPQRAAQLLDAALEDGRITPDAASWELLARAWLVARERDAALVPLRRAAERSKDGRLYLYVAQIHLDREEWAAARSALEQALATRTLRDRGTARLLVGVASAGLEDWAAARAAFESAATSDRTRDSARQWLARVEAAQALAASERTHPSE